MDDLYNKLLHAYKYGDYEKELKSVNMNHYNEAIKKLKVLSNEEKYIYYPEYDDELFYEKLLSKKEFNDIAGSKPSIIESYDKESSQRCSQSSFTLSSHQMFVKRLLSPQTPYNILLIYHGVGVGKTCSAISIAEQYIGLFKKKVLIIASGNIHDTFKKQIFDITKYNITSHTARLCTGTKYPDMIIDRHNISKEMFQKRIDKLINNRYQFMGYKELVNLIMKVRKKIESIELNPEKQLQRFNEKIKELFSNRLIIIDEAHNLRMPSENGKKQIASTFEDLMNIIENVKLILMTATPMFNDHHEIIWMLNLLLSVDRRPKLRKSDIFVNGEITLNGKKKLESICKGYISYMKGENPFTFPFRLFPKMFHDKNLIYTYPSIDFKGKFIHKEDRLKELQLIGSIISQRQLEVYEKLMKVVNDNIDDNDNDETYENDDDSTTNDFQNVLQLCNVVYPSENIKRCYGKDGFYDYMKKTHGNKGIRLEYRNINNQIFSYNNINGYSPKLKTILDYIINSKGIVFVYSQYYHSGILPLAIALEHIGCNKLHGNITDKINVQQKMQLINGKRPNYVILSRDRDFSPNNDDEINVARSLQNANGELIKVIIASKIATEGIDLSNIREIHILDPWYNLNRIEQIIGRGVRTCSHISLPKEHRNTSIFMHALSMYNPEQESIDLRIYRIAENKQISINKIENVLKSSAVDCEFNKHNIDISKFGNNIVFDITTSQGVKIPNFDISKLSGTSDYTCIGKKRNFIDTSTYSYEMLNDEIDIYKKYIVDVFKIINKCSYSELLQYIKSSYKIVDEDILRYALQFMLDEPYSFVGYKEQKGILLYANNKYIFKTDMLIDDSAIKNRIPLSSLSEQIKYKTTNSKDIDTYNDNSNTVNIIEKIEKDVEQYLKHVPEKFIDYIYDVVIDRLNTNELIHLISLYEADDIPMNIKKSIDNGKFILFDNNNIRGFYNHIDKSFYCKKNNTYMKCSSIDIVKMNDIITKMRKNLYDSFSLTGYIQSKKNNFDFKIRDGKTSGYVCRNTHSLLVDDLRQRITKIDASIPFSNLQTLSKAKLCDIYEILLRQNNDFHRPFLYA